MESPSDPQSEADSASPPVRRGLGVVGRTLMLGVGLVVAFFGGLVVVALLTGYDPDDLDAGADAGAATPPRLGSSAVPDALPSASLDGFAGDAAVEVPDDYAGQLLLVNFWATWCAPCVEEMPDLQRLHEAVGDEVAFLGVNVSDAPSNAEAFVDELGITYDLAVDADGDYFRAIESVGMPTTLLVDADGRIADHHAGLLTAADLQEWLADVFEVQP